MPTTVNRKFSIPTTGSEVGVWGSNDLNPNFSAIDAILGSVTTLNLAGTGSITLNDAQQQVGIIRLTGAMTGNWTLTVTEPAFWFIDNQTTGNFVYTLGGSSGNVISTPQGSRYQVAWDGTNAFLMNQPPPSTYMRLGVTSVPLWMNANTVPPWLACRGGTQSISTFPALAALLSTAFGGNGISTFGIPDMQGRDGYDLDNGAGRISATSMSPNGNTLGASGGDERPQAHNHTGSGNVNDPGHTHTPTGGNQWCTPVQGLGFTTSNFGGPNVNGTGVSSQNTTGITVPSLSINNAFAGAGQNMGPTLVAGITFIKT